MDKLELAIETIYDALTTTWEDNGNIMADAMREHVITNLSMITELSFDEIAAKVEKLAEEKQ